MKIKQTIMVLLAILVIISLVGCVQMQEKKTEKEDKEPVSSVDEEAGDSAEKEADETEEKEETEETKETEEADEAETEKEEEPEQTPEEGLPVKEVTEGDLVSFPNLKATDPDGDPIQYKFSEPLDEEGKWQTEEGDAGEYTVSITASDGKNNITQKVKILVKSLNKPPVIELESDEIEIDEGEKIELDVKAHDPDGDAIKIRYEGWMKGPVKETTYYDSGEHTVTIIASDDKEEVRKELTIKVNNVNRAPNIEPINDVALTEGDKVTIKPVASDPDGDRLAYTFSKPLDKDGIWETEEGDAGKYRINITASDGDKEAATNFFIVVESLNRPPVIDLAQTEISVEEGDTVTIDAEITDPEDDELTITYTGWMTSDTYTTDYDDSGTHAVTITVTDGINEVSEDVTVIVRDKNRPPVFDPSAFN